MCKLCQPSTALSKHIVLNTMNFVPFFFGQMSKSNNFLFIYSLATITMYLLVYVDDLILTRSHRKIVSHFIALLNAHFHLSMDLLQKNFGLWINVARWPFITLLIYYCSWTLSFSDRKASDSSELEVVNLGPYSINVSLTYQFCIDETMFLTSPKLKNISSITRILK